jgi:ribonuclease D
MFYLTDPQDIKDAIARYSQCQRLWLDTEVADYQSKQPRLSLISILDDPTDLRGDRVTLLDLLDRSDLADEFIDAIATNSNIEKVFHNAKYDLNFLGKRKANHVTCTLEMVQKIPYYLAPVPNYTLKALAEHLCSFPPISKTEQSGDWGHRPLTPSQLHYAKMDAVYVAQVHLRLLQLHQIADTDPTQEDIDALILRYRQIEHQWKRLTTEMEHLQKRLKTAMQQQNISEQLGFKLKTQRRTTKQVAFKELAKLTQDFDLDLDLSVTLNKSLQKELGTFLEQLPIEEKVQIVTQLQVSEQAEDDLPF